MSGEATKYHESEILDISLRKQQVQPIPDVVYAQKPTLDFKNALLQMNIWRPRDFVDLPAVIFITGGGFIAANRARLPQLRMRLAENGYFVGSISYRVAPEVMFPAPLEDVKSAIRYIKAHAAELNVDPERVAVVGDSAGGYLSAFAGITSGSIEFDEGENLHVSSSVKAAVTLYGLSDSSKVAEDYSNEMKRWANSAAGISSLLVNGVPVFGGRDGGIEANTKYMEKSNPINYINEKSVPMLLFHGGKDALISPSQTDILYQALRNRGIEAKRYVVPQAEHAGPYWIQDEVLDIVQAFLDKHMK